MAYEYVRTDKNGTKIYHDYTCDRCGGKGIYYVGILNGELQPSHLDSGVCWKCHGTGRMEHPHIHKEYTPEYEAKLNAQREKRQAKKQAEADAKRAQVMAELESHLPEMLAKHNFNADGKQYAVYGDTYPIRQELKDAGAKWNNILKAWVFAEKPSQYDVVEIDWQEYMFISDYRNDLDVLIDYSYGRKDGAKLVKGKIPQDDVKISEYVGSIGERIDKVVTLNRVFTWTQQIGWMSQTMFCYKFIDESGNVLVWKTSSSNLLDQEGNTIHINGTIKAHDTYNAEKQTALARVKMVA